MLWITVIRMDTDSDIGIRIYRNIAYPVYLNFFGEGAETPFL